MSTRYSTFLFLHEPKYLGPLVRDLVKSQALSVKFRPAPNIQTTAFWTYQLQYACICRLVGLRSMIIMGKEAKKSESCQCSSDLTARVWCQQIHKIMDSVNIYNQLTIIWQDELDKTQEGLLCLLYPVDWCSKEWSNWHAKLRKGKQYFV